MEHVDVEGLRIAYRQAGAGPPLVCLHGAFSDSRAWRRQLEGLSDAFTVVAWDAPGCGGSTDPPEDFGMAGYADALAGFLVALGLDRPAVLGLSFGGGLALALYERHPHLPGALVLASAYAGWAGSLPPEQVEERRQRALRESTRPPAEWIEGYLPGLLTDDAPPELAEELLGMMAETRPATMRTMLEAFADADLRPVLPHVAVPTLLLYGDADRRAPLPVAEALHAQMPTSELVVLPGAPHAANLEMPEAFNAAVRTFLARHVEPS